jgi:peptidyl-prolyl cis-trans isomerase C
MIPALAFAPLLTLGASAPQPTSTNAPQAAAASPDAVVAKAKGFQITRSQLDQEVDRAKVQVAASGRLLVREEMSEIPRQVLEQLINVQLLDAKATAADKAAGKESAEKRLAQAKAKAGSEEAFSHDLRRMGASPALLLSKWTEAFTAEAVLKRELKIQVTDQEVRKEYDDNFMQFQAPEMVRMSHILLATRDPKSGGQILPDQQAAKRKQAEVVLKRARSGEDFAKLAREFSDDPISKYKGGEYTFAHGGMVPEVEKAAFGLKTNQISDIVTSDYGYHIIKLNEKIPAHQIRFADAAPDIRNGLIQQEIQKQFPTYIAKLREVANVEILDENLKPRTTVGPDQYLPLIRGFQPPQKSQGSEPIPASGAPAKRPG